MGSFYDSNFVRGTGKVTICALELPSFGQVRERWIVKVRGWQGDLIQVTVHPNQKSANKVYETFSSERGFPYVTMSGSGVYKMFRAGTKKATNEAPAAFDVDRIKKDLESYPQPSNGHQSRQP